jgi:predicted secreted protein
MPRSLASRLCQALLLGSLSGLLACGVLALRGGSAAAVAAEWEPELAPGRTLSLSSQDNDRTIHLRRGEQLRLVMGGNAGTGYRWVINAINRRQLELVSAELWSDPGPLIGPGRRPGLVGGPQQTTFLFRVVGNGASDLQLKYWPGPARASASDPSFRVRVESGTP